MPVKNGAKSFIEARFGKTRALATTFVVPLEGVTSKAANGHVIELVGSIKSSSPRSYIGNLVDGLNHRQGNDVRERMEMNLYGIAAVLCLVVWVTLAFVLAFPTGWVHIPLIIGVLLIVRAIVDGKQK